MMVWFLLLCAASTDAAARLAAATITGGWIPVAGWVLLGLGMAASLGAAVLEPTKLEDWARRTPFGNGPDDKKFKTQGEQQKALHEALGLVVQPDAQEPQSA